MRIPIYARLVRGTVLSVKEKEYIEACRAVGQYDPRILLWHILPNCMTPIMYRHLKLLPPSLSKRR